MSMIDAAATSPPVPRFPDAAATAADVPGGEANAAGAAADMPGIATVRPSTDVRISMSGSALASGRAAKQASSRDSDIDNSNLPDNVGKLVKRLRELREKLEQKARELQELSNSTTGNPEQRRMRVEALRTEIGALTAVMDSVNADLAEATRKFSSDEKLRVAGLIMG